MGGVLNAPLLSTIDGNLDVYGNKSMSEANLPNLEVINGNFVAAGSGFTRLPAKLGKIGGDAIIADTDPESLMDDLKRAKRDGILQGNLFCLITKL